MSTRQTTKTIYHPGEVNKIRECHTHPNLVATHTDSTFTYLWNVERQPNRKKDARSHESSKPELILEGHEDLAEYALACSARDPCFASGGKDKLVVLWDLGDHVTSLAGGLNEDGAAKGRSSLNSGGLGDLKQATLSAKIKLKGHTDTVESVAFHPQNSHELVSVADDKSIRLWDVRKGETAVTAIENAHEGDIQCVDWSAKNENHILTGSEDASVKVFDRRKMGGDSNSELFHLKYHTQAILHVEWSPDKEGICGTAGQDGILNVWDLNKTESRTIDIPKQLLFQHVGHRSQIEEFQWNLEDPWTIMSVSNDQLSRELEAQNAPPGTLQVWRMNDIIYRPEEEVLKELEEHKNKL